MRYQLHQALGIYFTRSRDKGTFQPTGAATTSVSRAGIPGELSHLDRLLQPSLIPGHPNRAQDDMTHLLEYIMHRYSRASQNPRKQARWEPLESTVHRLMDWNDMDVRTWCELIRQRTNAGGQARWQFGTLRRTLWNS